MIENESQLGNPSTPLCVQFTLRIEEARDALARFEEAIQKANWPGVIVDQFTGDMETLHAELTRAWPSPTILQDAGKTLRKTFASVTARIEVPNIIAAAQALWPALGLSEQNR
jgi:hypothetical protein